ncbi:MAG: alpha/beta hydrolase [Eubacteriales bacterium]|nr:alpha/beta hydrolase [Eubacteriales bacterium]
METWFDLPCADSVIKCKLYHRESAGGPAPEFMQVRHVVLFCHGLAGHRDNAMAHKLADRILMNHEDTVLLIFNWPGHGDDVRQALDLEDCDLYLRTILQYIRDRLQPEVLDVSATSFGGYLILKYLTDYGTSPFRRICLRCPAVVMDQVLTQVLTGDELQTLSRGGVVPYGFDRKTDLTQDFLDSLRQTALFDRDVRPFSDRIVIAQGTADELVPCEAVCAFAQRNHLRLVLVRDADHRFLDPAKMDYVLTTFLDHLGL